MFYLCNQERLGVRLYQGHQGRRGNRLCLELQNSQGVQPVQRVQLGQELCLVRRGDHLCLELRCIQVLQDRPLVLGRQGSQVSRVCLEVLGVRRVQLVQRGLGRQGSQEFRLCRCNQVGLGVLGSWME